MAGEKQENPWPVPKFHFKVTIGNIGEIAFQEVNGLETESDENSIDFSAARMPGLKKNSDVTFKKGMFQDNKKLLAYFQETKMNTIQRKTIVIELMDEEGKPMFRWSLKNAWPMQFTGLDLNTKSSEVAIETIVFAHEGLTFEQRS